MLATAGEDDDEAAGGDEDLAATATAMGMAAGTEESGLSTAELLDATEVEGADCDAPCVTGGPC